MVRNYLIESLWPLVTNAVDLGAVLARWRKLWSVDADFSGVVTVTRTPVDGTDVPNKTYVDALFVPLIATIEEVDGAPSYASPSVLRFDQADGFVLTQPAAGIVRVDLGTIPITSISGSFTDLGTTLTGQLAVADGGTNLTSYTIGDILYASAATTIASLVDVAIGNAVISGGVGVAPSYGKIGLTTHITGTLPVLNGGTNLTAGTDGGILGYTAVGTLASSALLTLRGLLIGGGAGATPTSIAALTNGQLAIGSTGANPVPAALTAGANITVTNAAGSITLAAPTSLLSTHVGYTAVIAQATTIYMNTFGHESTETPAHQIMPFACTLSNMYVENSSVGGAGQTVVYTLFKNTIATALTATVNSGGTTANDLVNTVTFAAGDNYSVRCVLSATTGSITGETACFRVTQ